MNTISTLEKEDLDIPEDLLKNRGRSDFLRSLFVTTKELKTINLFWIGIIIYTLGYTLSVTDRFNVVLCQFVQLIGIMLFVSSTYRLFKFKLENKYLQVLFIIYFTWSMSVIFRGLELNYYNIKLMLFEAYEGAFLYFVPLVIFLPKNLLFYKKAFDTIIILAFFTLLHELIVIGDILNRGSEEGKGYVEIFTKTLAVPSGLILLTFMYHPARRKLFALGIVVVSALLAIYRARRSLLLMSLNPLLFSYLFYLISSNKRVLIVFFSLFIAVFLGLFAESLINKENDKGLFSQLMERGTVDTRTGVEECLFNDMKPMDWIIGKGMNGKYYCPNIELDGETDYRTGIESDYLHLILKGGLVHLGLVLLIMVPAVFKGFFLSKNFLSKAAAIWILFYLMYLYPSPVTKFNLNYLLVWISLGICYSNSILKMPEKIVKAYYRAEIKM